MDLQSSQKPHAKILKKLFAASKYKGKNAGSERDSGIPCRSILLGPPPFCATTFGIIVAWINTGASSP
jgi:hypothetical protein